MKTQMADLREQSGGRCLVSVSQEAAGVRALSVRHHLPCEFTVLPSFPEARPWRVMLRVQGWILVWW